MTIEEAIKHAEEVADEKENEGKLLCQSEGASIGCLTCAEEHRQLAEWLRDYKRLKEQEPCDDAISREAVLNIVNNPLNIRLDEIIKKLPPVNPQPKTGRCKDCKWWKDSDGFYRRGGHAESQCPINRREVFEGNGYCYMFAPQERSDKG